MRESEGIAPLEAQIFLNLIRTEERMMAEVKALLGERGLSAPQYNVLRILRGVAGEGLPCRRISERMVSRLPDVTRLLDRLESAKLVTRERNPGDRRVVTARITAGGRELLDSLDGPIGALHRDQFTALSREELLQLNVLLRKARESG